MIRTVLTTLALAALASLTHAAGVVPAYTTFGNLAGANIGGTGIPTDPTAITTANGFTLGLTAFGRYQNPALTNNGAGTFYATAGANNGLGVVPQSIGTTWAFGFYINGGTAQLGNYQIDLLYDLNPAAGTPLADLGRIDIDAALNGAGFGGLSVVQDAQNQNSAFFSTGNAVTTAPSSAPFNPNAAGEYALVLRVRDQSGNDLATSSILVNVVPEPASLALVALALVGAGAASRRRRA